MSLLPVEGHSGFARNSVSGAIVNINKNDIQVARNRKARDKQLNQERLDTKEAIGSLQDQMDSLDKKLNLILEKL